MNNSTLRTDVKRQTLFGADSLSADSPWFVLDSQHTVTAAGLTPDLEVRFRMAVIKGGEVGVQCPCSPRPPAQAEIERTEWLLCANCDEADERSYVRLTYNNQYVVLDSPQGSAIQAVLVYANSGEPVLDTAVIQDVRVQAYAGTHVSGVTDAQRGCPPCQQTKHRTASFVFPTAGRGYSLADVNRDPRANVELTDCEGDMLAFIYPQPTQGATTAVKDCEGNVLGYALDDNHGNTETECDFDLPNAVGTVVINGALNIIYADGSIRPYV